MFFTVIVDVKLTTRTLAFHLVWWRAINQNASFSSNLTAINITYHPLLIQPHASQCCIYNISSFFPTLQVICFISTISVVLPSYRTTLVLTRFVIIYFSSVLFFFLPFHWVRFADCAHSWRLTSFWLRSLGGLFLWRRSKHFFHSLLPCTPGAGRNYVFWSSGCSYSLHFSNTLKIIT